MMKTNNNQLTEHIKEILYDHEEPYVLGSWERFQHYKKEKNRMALRRTAYSAAATVLLIVTFLFSRIYTGQTPSGQYAEESLPQTPDAIQQTLPQSSPETEPLGAIDVENEGNTPQNIEPDYKINTTESSPGFFEQIHNSFPRKSIALYSVTKPRFPSPENMHQHINRNRQNVLNQDQFYMAQNTPKRDEHIIQGHDIRNTLTDKSKKDFVFSVAYASMMNIHDSETDFSTGGGFYADWNFTKQMALSSGFFIGQNRLKYKTEHENSLLIDEDDTEPGLFSSEDLSFIQLDLVNVEVPLNIRYFITDNFSVSAGVSTVAFLKENYNYNYEYEQQIQVFETNETSNPEPVSRTVTFKTSQTQSEPSLNTINWAGMYTFSAGYQHDFGDHYAVSFEPFVKIPGGQITSRDIIYTTGGIQLKISF